MGEKVKKTVTDKFTFYTGVTIEKTHAFAAKDLSYMIDKGFVDWNHRGRSANADHILGEPIGLYHSDKVLKADIMFYNEQLEKIGGKQPTMLKIIECCVPSVSGRVLERDENGNITSFLLTGISIGPNNVDPSIEKIKIQMQLTNDETV